MDTTNRQLHWLEKQVEANRTREARTMAKTSALPVLLVFVKNPGVNKNHIPFYLKFGNTLRELGPPK